MYGWDGCQEIKGCYGYPEENLQGCNGYNREKIYSCYGYKWLGVRQGKSYINLIINLM